MKDLLVEGVRRSNSLLATYYFPNFFLIASVSAGTITNKSPTTPYRACVKIGASASLLMATISLAFLIPTKCWIAPEIPQAMYKSGATTLPVWPTWWA